MLILVAVLDDGTFEWIEPFSKSSTKNDKDSFISTLNDTYDLNKEFSIIALNAVTYLALASQIVSSDVSNKIGLFRNTVTGVEFKTVLDLRDYWFGSHEGLTEYDLYGISRNSIYQTVFNCKLLSDPFTFLLGGGDTELDRYLRLLACNFSFKKDGDSVIVSLICDGTQYEFAIKQTIETSITRINL